MLGQILYSGQLSTTSATTVYTAPASTTAKIATMTVCNTSASAVTLTVQLLQSGQSADGTHAVISGYSLGANDTLSLTGYIGGAMLATAEAISVTAGTANVIDVVITGAVSS
jgi:3-oxoacyl-(acyl-carrier-protein) synthase